MEAHLNAGISAIGAMTLFRGVSEADVATRLAALARLWRRCNGDRWAYPGWSVIDYAIEIDSSPIGA
jgi:hypothetical protein